MEMEGGRGCCAMHENSRAKCLHNAMCEHASALMHLMSTMRWQAAMFCTNMIGNAMLSDRWVQLLSLPAEGCKSDILHAVWPRLQ